MATASTQSYHPVTPQIADPNLPPPAPPQPQMGGGDPGLGEPAGQPAPQSKGFFADHKFAIIASVVVLIILVVLLYVYLAIDLAIESQPNSMAIESQPNSTIRVINNTTEAPFTVYIEYANYNKVLGINTLAPPPLPWAILTASTSAGVTLSPPMSFYPGTYPGIYNATAPYHTPNDVGSSTWQILSMPTRGDIALLSIPDFPIKQQAWSLRPLKNNAAGNPCGSPGGSSEDDCGMPILIESGKDMVGDMSAVDGVNFLLCYELTTKNGSTSVMDFKTNPCTATGQNPKGCTNPSVNGIFDPELVRTSGCLPASSSTGPYCWQSAPCPAGTCNLYNASKTWCDAINDGQCSNSTSTWPASGQGDGGPDSCKQHNLYTTYCYSHNDAPSSPWFGSPYKMKLTYSDLA